MLKLKDEWQCPRCSGGIPNDAQKGQYPGALSRLDNETYVCSSCGQEEALIQFAASQSGESPQNAMIEDYGQWYVSALERIINANDEESAKSVLLHFLAVSEVGDGD